MVADATRVLRNAGPLMIQPVLHMVAATLFAVLVPRALGLAQFGRYSLLVSVSLCLALLSGLGAVPMMTRSVPRSLVFVPLAVLRVPRPASAALSVVGAAA